MLAFRPHRTFAGRIISNACRDSDPPSSSSSNQDIASRPKAAPSLVPARWCCWASIANSIAAMFWLQLNRHCPARQSLSRARKHLAFSPCEMKCHYWFRLVKACQNIMRKFSGFHGLRSGCRYRSNQQSIFSLGNTASKPPPGCFRIKRSMPGLPCLRRI